MRNKLKTSEVLIDGHLRTRPQNLSVKTNWMNFFSSLHLQICYPVTDELFVKYFGNEIEIMFNIGHRVSSVLKVVETLIVGA